MQSDAGGGASWIDSSSSSATGRKTRSLTCAGCCASPPSPPRARGSPSARHSWPRCSGGRGRGKLISEGEEEIGSVHFEHYVHENREALAGDACIWEFGERDMHERLNMVAGVKGICYLDLSLITAARDLHSQYGAIVEGAAMRLIWALGTLKDPATGRIRVPGFYDRVRAPPPGEKARVRALPFDEEERRAYYGVQSWIGGKRAEAAQYDLYFSPTCTVCGFHSGYTGPGSKTVLPAR